MYFDSFKAVMMRLAFNPSYNDSFGGPDQTGLEERIGLDWIVCRCFPNRAFVCHQIVGGVFPGVFHSGFLKDLFLLKGFNSVHIGCTPRLSRKLAILVSIKYI